MVTRNYSSYKNEDLMFNHTIQYDFDWEFTTHSHDVCELLFLKKGDVSYNVEGKIYNLPKNSLVISRGMDMHSIKSNNPTDYERYNVIFDEQKLSSDIYYRIPNSVDVINFDGNDLVCRLFKKFDYYSENFEGNTLKFLLLHLVEEILCNVLLSSKEFEQRDICTTNHVINHAIKYINANITVPLNIDDVCNELYITKSHLHHLFMHQLNISPKKYIMSRKLSLCQRELRSGAKPTEVSANYGFADYSTFYKAYRQYFGHSPSEEANAEIIRELYS